MRVRRDGGIALPGPLIFDYPLVLYVSKTDGLLHLMIDGGIASYLNPPKAAQ